MCLGVPLRSFAEPGTDFPYVPIGFDCLPDGGLNGGYRLVGAFIIAGSSPLRARFDRGAINDTHSGAHIELICCDCGCAVAFSAGNCWVFRLKPIRWVQFRSVELGLRCLVSRGARDRDAEGFFY